MKKIFYCFSLVLAISSLFLSSCEESNIPIPDKIYRLDATFDILKNEMIVAEVAHIDEYSINEYSGVISIIPIIRDFSREIPVIGIGDSAFCDCTKLISVVLPSTIQYVNKDAFTNCTALTTIVCKSVNPPTIDPTAFKGCETDKITLYVALESVDAYKQNDVWKTLNVKAYAVEE